MSETDPLRDDLAASGAAPPRVVLSAVVYAERGHEILLLRRAEGSALAGQWFLPGGMVEAGEHPEEGARRELREEAGVEIEGELELLGCYPLHVYGFDTLQLSFRGRVAGDDPVVVSHEHVGARWVRAADMRARLTDEVIAQTAGGDARITALLGHIRADLDRYLRRTGAGVGVPSVGRLFGTAFDCPDPAALAAFYAAITGWPIEADEDDDWVQLRSDRGATLAFQLVPDHRPPTWPNGERPQQAHLDIDVADLDIAEEQVLALGARKADVQPGTTFRVYLDPAGHPFCLVLAG